MKVFSGMFATPPRSTKILKGAGGGNSAGTISAMAPCLRIKSDARSTHAALESLLQQRLAPLAPDEIEREAAGNRTERRHRGVQHHPFGMVDTISTMSRSLTSGNDRKDESRNAMTKSPGAPTLRANASIHAVIRAIRDYYSIREVTDRFPKVLSAAGLLIGTSAALIYYFRGLTLSHYDAKAHLVVARRVLDSLTPEYSQIGAVWLPLPHLLNLLPGAN